jgi:hypothetical protein
MSTNKKIVWGIVGVIVLVVIFYGGVMYGKGQSTTTAPTAYSGTKTRGAGFGGTGGVGSFGGLTAGQIISKNASSITISLASGGSKIIFVDDSTKISKQATGTLADLAVGTNVAVTGAANTDGSLNATMVQIRPNAPTTQPATTTPSTTQ